MKKLLLLIILFSALKSYSQNYTSPGIPSGTSSFTPTFRTKAATPDSLAQIWLAIGGNKFYRMLSGMDVIVFKATDFEGLGTTSNKLGLRDTLLKSNWVINPADTLHPALTVISDKAQAGLLIKPNESTDGRAVVQMRSAKNNQWWEVGANPAGQNKSFGIRRMNGVALPAVDYLWYVEPFTDTSVFPHQVRFTNTRAYTPGDSVAYLKNGFLEIGPASGGGGNTIYTVNDSLVSDRIVTQHLHDLQFLAESATDSLNAEINKTTFSAFYFNKTDHYSSDVYTSNGISAIESSDASGGTASINTNSVVDRTSDINISVTDSLNRGKSIQLISRFSGTSTKGIYVTDKIDSVGLKYTDTASYKNGHLDSLWIPPVAYIQSHFAPIGGTTTIHTSNGLSGDGSVGAPVVLGGTITGAGGVADIQLNNPSGANTAAFNVEDPNTGYGLFLGGNGTDFQSDMVGGAQDFSSNSIVNAASVLTLQLNVSATHKSITMSPSSGFGIGVADFDDKGLTGLDNGGAAYVYPVSGSGAQYAQYGHVQQPITLTTTGTSGASTLVGTTLNIPQYAGSTGANPTASIGFTAVNGSAGTFTRSDGAPKADSTVIRSVANSYSLSGMQTKLNNYALTSALPVGANPTATAGSSAVNGSAVTFMRSDAAPKVDSAVFRTVANSYSLSGLQTKFNGYVPTSTTVAGFALSSNVTLAALTATDATLTFSGSYTGATARTVGLNLGNANTWTAAQSVVLTALGTTQTEAQRWQNTTAAAVGAVQISPFSVWYGNNWSTGSTASVLFGFRAYTLPIQNSSGYNGEWHLQGLTALNTWADALKVDNGGTLTAVNFVSNGGEVNSGTFRNASNNVSINLQTARTFNAAGNIIQFNPGSITNSSGLVIGLNATQTINQTSTASYTYNQVNLTETAVGSGGAKFVDYQVAGTSKYSVKDDGTINSAVLTASTPLQTDASKNVISSPVGQTTLVAGTKAITITGLTTSSKAFVTLVSQGGTVTTTQVYAAVCTTNTLTITALTTAGATDTTDTSVLNYFVVVQ